MQEKLFSRKIFLTGWLIFLVLSLSFLLFYGKSQSHVSLTSFYTPATDTVFKYLTWVGNGFFVILLAFLMSFFRFRWLLLILLSFAISGILAQILKNFIFPDTMRPSAFFDGTYTLHIVPGVKMLRAHSFPSGHSASAFALFFSLAHITRQRSWEVFWLIMAVAVSYSRVYLSQHFLIDILGGSLIGIIAGILSLIILKRINKPWLEKNLANIIHHAH